MRKFMIAAAFAASTFAVAAPAAAEHYQHPTYGWQHNPGYGYQHNPGYGWGYHNNYGQVRRLQARIDQLQHHINRLDRYNVLSNREARRLRQDSREIERRLRYSARNGLNGRERYGIERAIQRLEIRIHREARDRNHWRY